MIEFQTENGKITVVKESIFGIFEKSIAEGHTEFQDIPLIAFKDGTRLALSEDYDVAIEKWKNG